MALTVSFWVVAALAVFSGWRVFRADSMVRAAYWLLLSFAMVGLILVFIRLEFLGLILILMMGGEMTIMAVFMVMFMMNPAGLNPMTMVHRHRVAIVAGVLSFLAVAALGLFATFPAERATPPQGATGEESVTGELGAELLGDSMLVFQTAGITLMSTMIAAIALTSVRGRFGDAQTGSEPPPQQVAASEGEAATPAATSAAPPAQADDQAGHGDHVA
jgi:NADH:ubiquinone oxidoreductase subunit 6 (subunit J)